MKIFYAENQPDYATYTFNYAIYCIRETKDELPAIYNKGFLPYTGNPKIEPEIFYLARSLRVDLDLFGDTSENRRIDRRITPLSIQLTVKEKSNELISDTAFFNFCMDYAGDRFSGNAMTSERFKYVLGRATGNYLFSFTFGEEALGYVLAAIEGDSLHYWYAFFNQNYMKSHSLGKWMMWKTIHWAKAEGLKYVYLGTCYGNHSLYKVRDHKGLEYFDGSSWNGNIKLLKELCKTDNQEIDRDRFKLLADPNEFILKLGNEVV